MLIWELLMRKNIKIFTHNVIFAGHFTSEYYILFHGAAAAEVQQNQRQKLLGVRVAFVLSDAYGSIDDSRQFELVPKLDYGEKTGKGRNVLHLVCRSNLDFWLSVWHNLFCTSQVMAFCLAT